MSDFTISAHVFVTLALTKWSGWAKFPISEVKGASKVIPPKELYNGGSIKTFDTDLLNQFRNFKTRADTIVAAMGCKFIEGWLVDAANIPDLENQLGECHSDWANALARFVQDYPAQADAWAKSCGQWEALVRQKQPTDFELWSKFRFHWQTFRLVPETASAWNTRGNETADLINELPNKALQSVINSLRTLYDDSFNKPEPSPKAYNALLKIAQRARALGFANPEAARLAPVLETLGTNRNHILTKIVLSKMNQPKDVAELLEFNDVQGLDALLPSSAPAQPEPDLLLEQAKQMLKPAPVQAPLNSMDVLDSLGLF